MSQALKEKLFDFAEQHCQGKLQEIQTALTSLRQAIQDDSKSSMGDKYETSREMAQQEINRLLGQQSQVQADIATLNKLQSMENQLQATEMVRAGSLVQVGEFKFFIATSLGIQKLEGSTYIMVSASSPIGKELLGKKIGEHIVFQGKQWPVIAIS